MKFIEVTVTQRDSGGSRKAITGYVNSNQYAILRELVHEQNLYLSAAIASRRSQPSKIFGLASTQLLPKKTKHALNRAAFLIAHKNANHPDSNSIIVAANDWKRSFGCILLTVASSSFCLPILMLNKDMGRLDKTRSLHVLVPSSL